MSHRAIGGFDTGWVRLGPVPHKLARIPAVDLPMTASDKPATTWLDRNHGLLRIVGTRLTSVQFMLDHLVLVFEDKGTLTTRVWPDIVNRDEALTYGQPGYRDRLCALIRRMVTGAAIDSSDTIRIYFGNDERLALPLDRYAGDAERAVLTGPRSYIRIL